MPPFQKLTFMKKILFPVVITILLSGVVKAQSKTETFSFSLQQAIEYAYQHDVNLLNADLDQQIAKAKVKETVGIGLPQINASLDVKDYFVENFLFPNVFGGGSFTGEIPGTFSGLPIKTPTYSATAAVQASQLIFDGSYIVGLQASKAYRELSQKTYTRTKIETAVSVSKAYYNLLVTRQRLELLDANILRLKKLNDDTQTMYDNGFVEKIDRDRIVLTYNNATVEREKMERLITLANYLFKYQVGINITANVVLTDSLSAESVKGISVPSEQADVTRRIEYSLLQSQQHLLQLDLKRNQFQYLPSLVLIGSLYTTEQRATLDVFNSHKKWYPTGFVGATLSVPLFNGLQSARKIDQAKLALKKMENEITNTTNALNLETETNRTMLNNALASFKTQGQNLELATEVARVSKIKYDQGVGSNLEVINAEALLKEAQTNYYNSMFDALVAKVDLDKALGNIK